MKSSIRLFIRLFTSSAFLLPIPLASQAAATDSIQYVNPDAAARVCKSTYHGRDGTYKIALAPMGAHLFIEDRDIAPGLTTHATIGDPDSGLLYIVSTRLRGDLAKDYSVLDRVEARSQVLAVRFPEHFSSRRGNGPLGRTYESTLINANKGNDESMPFPISVGYTPPQPADAIDGVAVNRHFVAYGYYYEVAVLMRNKSSGKRRSKEQLVAQANDWLDKSMAGFTVGKASACLGE